MFDKSLVKVFCNFDLVLILSKYIGDDKSIDSFVKIINKKFKCQFSTKKIFDFYSFSPCQNILCELNHPLGYKECLRCRLCHKLKYEHDCMTCFDYYWKFNKCCAKCYVCGKGNPCPMKLTPRRFGFYYFLDRCVRSINPIIYIPTANNYYHADCYRCSICNLPRIINICDFDGNIDFDIDFDTGKHYGCKTNSQLKKEENITNHTKKINKKYIQKIENKCYPIKNNNYQKYNGKYNGKYKKNWR